MSVAPAQPAQVLVVDDEPDLRTLYELTLLREGYRVDAAATLAEAWQQLDGKKFDAVITDMRLPDGLGLALLHRMAAQQRSERVIVMTAYGSIESAVGSQCRTQDRMAASNLIAISSISLALVAAAPIPGHRMQCGPSTRSRSPSATPASGQ